MLELCFVLPVMQHCFIPYVSLKSPESLCQSHKTIVKLLYSLNVMKPLYILRSCAVENIIFTAFFGQYRDTLYCAQKCMNYLFYFIFSNNWNVIFVFSNCVMQLEINRQMWPSGFINSINRKTRLWNLFINRKDSAIICRWCRQQLLRDEITTNKVVMKVLWNKVNNKNALVCFSSSSPFCRISWETCVQVICSHSGGIQVGVGWIGACVIHVHFSLIVIVWQASPGEQKCVIRAWMPFIIQLSKFPNQHYH